MANIKKSNISATLNDRPAAERSRSPTTLNDRPAAERSRSPTALNDRAAPGKRRERTPYHGAALNLVSYRLHKYQKKGDVTIYDELPLSKEPLRLDMMVVKKNRDTKLEPTWARDFRGYNVIEFKSPADKAPTLATFYKLLGYAHIYAAQNDVKISDITATIICAKTPKKLFKTLKEDFDYEILEKYEGVYYITEKGVAAEKRLAVQVVTQKSELLLQAMDKRPLDKDTTEKVAKTILAADKNIGRAPLGYWFKALNSENLENILERMRKGMRSEKAFQEVLESFGISDRCLWEKGVREGMQKGVQKGIQKGIQKGMQRGMQKGALEVITLLEKGYSLADAKKKLRLPATRTRRTRAKTSAPH